MKSTENVIISQAGPADLAALLPLYQAAAARPDCPWDAFYPNEAVLRTDLEAGRLYCARDDEGRLLGGYALAEGDPDTDPLPFWDRRLEPAGEVTRLVVAAPYENQGLGRRLLADGLERLARRGCKGCRILVACDNLRALRSYAKLDFRRVGRVRLYDIDFDCFEKGLSACSEGETI